MPVPSFLSSFADKAQSAINASPLAGHLPNVGHPRPSSPDAASQPSANQAAAQGGKSLTMENLSYQFRNLQQQYSTTTPIQRIITLEKGLAIDFEHVSREAKTQSKEVYTWGQNEAEDLRDVTDRLAFLNFVQGSLAGSLASKLDSARAPLKALRDAETSLQPKRNIRAGIQAQIGRLEHDQLKGNDKKIADLRAQLKRAEAEDQQLEKDIELLKRRGIKESEQIKWNALREYGEKLVLLSQAASPIIAVLPAIPPSATHPYTGHQTTGAVRASLQRALDNYKTGHINLPPQLAPADLSRSDTQSFGESHASELSSISSEVSTPADHTPPLTATKSSTESHVATQTSTAINPQELNQAPAPIPAAATLAKTTTSTAPAVSAEPSGGKGPAVTPTIAETGIPVSAGPAGPGPASGSLHDIKAMSATSPTPATTGSAPKHETAEEEKKRLAALYSLPLPSSQPASSAPPPAAIATPQAAASSSSSAGPQRHETAEEEKKRLEREERERLLHGDVPDVPNKDEDLPPYQD